MSAEDYYKILGVSKTASEDELKKAYRQLAMKFHPDKNPDNKAAEEQFKKVSEAYDVLRDPQKRKAYDQFGSMSTKAGFQKAYQGFGNEYAGRSTESFQDLFHEMFGDIFSGARKQKGSDLRYTLNISLEEAAQGCQKTIHFMRRKNGHEEAAKISVSVPAGVKDAQRLKLRGEGDSGATAALNGDLFVVINIREHPLFKVKATDIYLDLPISYKEACMGTEKNIPTITGSAQIKVPAGTSSGKSLRLKAKGLPIMNGTGYGDMYVKILVDVPNSLSPEQTELLKKLDQQLGSGPLSQDYEQRLQQLKKERT